MNEVEPPDYSGIYLNPRQIDYEEVDPPLRSLIRLINSQPWIRTYGCCAGHAYHGKNPAARHHFFIGVFLRADHTGMGRLRSWLDEANRINGSTGLRTEAARVHKHPLGQGRVDGWVAYRLTVYERRKRKAPMRSQTYLRMIRSLEEAWARLWPVSGHPVSVDQ
jgi:hypothetical protein